MSRDELVPAYVLHQHAYGNTSMLVEAFTASSGRIGLVARGVRRRGSRTRALLEPFQALWLGWRGRGELKTLTAVEAAGSRQVPQGRGLFAGYYCNELLLRLFERESAEPDAFRAYERVIAGLQVDGLQEAALRRFELDLLTILGYAPEFGRDAATGEPVDAAATYDFLPDSGPLPAAMSDPVPGSVRVGGRALLALARADFSDPGSRKEAQRVLRQALEPLLGGRPLKSRSVYLDLYGPASPHGPG